ncbi:MAG TPA: hypothetical protein VFU00_10145 [Gemmatimonadales bacterium]|nr:hypothetical protein [Gemmatimonadales bacterium]
MRVTRLAVAAAIAVAPIFVAPVAAQTRVVVGVESDRSGYPAAYRRPPARRWHAPRIVYVERIVVRGNDRARDRWWRRHGYRPVKLYYWRGRFYERDIPEVATRLVVVYERGGRYYRDAGYRYDRYDRFQWDDRYYKDDRYWYDDRTGRYERDDRDDRDRYRDEYRDRDRDGDYDREEYRRDRERR